MRKIFGYADEYVKRCGWKDMALLKICLCAVGIMIGLLIPKDKMKVSFVTASVIFVVSYIPLMAKFVSIVWKEHQGDLE